MVPDMIDGDIPVPRSDREVKSGIKPSGNVESLLVCKGVLTSSLSSGVFLENGKHCSDHPRLCVRNNNPDENINPEDWMHTQGIYPRESTLSAQNGDERRDLISAHSATIGWRMEGPFCATYPTLR